VGITLAGFLGSAFAADNFSDKLVSMVISWGVKIPESTLDTIAVIFITLILSYFTLVLGELVPKRIAMRKAEAIALALAGLVSFISKVAAPLVWLLTASTNGILRLLGIDPHAEDEEVTEEEIRMLVDAGSEKGAINPEEKEMIENVFEFNNKTADEVMTHRTEVSLLWLDESIEQWEKTIVESRHSNYPICKETVDNIIGVLNIKDYYRITDKTRDNILKQSVKPAYFVPESVRTDILFQNMRKSRNHFAIVLDEYGGMSGIITMNDLIEEIVGDLGDDHEDETPVIERIDAGTWKIRGSASLEYVAEQLGIYLPDDEYETFGGFVFGLLGNVPDDGSRPEIEDYGLHIKVQEVREHRMEVAVVCLLDKKEK
jgi:putative hemolysin